MHAELFELIAMRDGEPVDAGVMQHLDRCVHCREQLKNLSRTREVLNSLPMLPPPDAVWERIRAARELETVTVSRRLSYRIAAAVAVMAVTTAIVSLSLLRDMSESQPDFTDVSPVTAESSGFPRVTLVSLQDESRQLENLLQSLGPRRATVSLHTASAIGELEDNITWIDYALANASVTEDERKALWQQRIELLESLLAVRAAQASSI